MDFIAIKLFTQQVFIYNIHFFFQLILIPEVAIILFCNCLLYMKVLLKKKHATLFCSLPIAKSRGLREKNIKGGWEGGVSIEVVSNLLHSMEYTFCN